MSIVLILMISSITLYAQKEKKIEKTFSGKSEIKIKLVLGSCYINKSNDNNIHVHLIHSYNEGDFEPKFKEKSKSVVVQEKFYGDDHDGGYSKWTISIPENMEVDFNSATGDLFLDGVSDVEIDGSSGTGEIEIENASGEFKLNSGTGYVQVADSKGEFDLNSGTGRVKIKNSQGDFDANSGTGNVEATDITIEDEADFNSGTGDAEVIRPKGTDYDLSISSGTNDAILDMDGLPIKGYSEFKANARSGKIVCPEKFDREEEYEQGDNEYIKKSFTKGGDTPRVFISTGTGKAKLSR